MARKKEVKSIVPDDLFDDDFFDLSKPKAYEFGTFRIIGIVELLALNQYTNVDLFLYFNHWNKSFFMVMKYKSGKIWLEELNYSEKPIHNLCSLDYYVDKEVCRISEDDEFRGVLKYNNYDKMFIYYNTNNRKQKLRRI